MASVIYSEILKEVDESWSSIEKAKYIYNQICKLSRYDERFIYSQNEQLLNNIYFGSINIDEPMEAILVCRRLNLIYSELLNRLGIKNKCIEKPSNIKDGYTDVALVFYDESGCSFFTNIAADLQRCKYGMKTQFFGQYVRNFCDLNSDIVTVLPEDELRKIDEKIGYVKKDRDYSDVVFHLISSEVKQNSEFLKILTTAPDIVRRYLNKKGIDNVSDDEIPGYVKNFDADDVLKIKMMVANYMKHHNFDYGYTENKSQSKVIFNSLFNKTEKRLYDSFDMVRENADEVDILSIIRVKLKSEYLYFKYSQETHEYELMPVEEALLIAEEYKSHSNQPLIEDEVPEI